LASRTDPGSGPVAPSLNFQGFGGDTANLTLSVALRGINPNDTLVLINGKRRHTTANLAVLGGSPIRAAPPPTFPFPTAHRPHRSVAGRRRRPVRFGRDRGRGQHHPKNANHGGTFTASGGSNYQNGGETAQAALNAGFKLGDKGFLNVTGEYKFHDYTQHGTCDRRFFNANAR
jgi:iron complex outermembrane receptor protein